MATKTVELDGIGTVNLYKRKGARNIRLSVTSTGKIRVTMPSWIPYSAGISFAKQRQDWLKAQAKPRQLLTNGMAIGKQHRLVFRREVGRQTVTARLRADKAITIKLPVSMDEADEKSQAAASKACIRALKREAEDALPGRLRQLAGEHGFDYRSVEVKHLKSRWGSCTHQQEIVLNCFLMQLPWHLIDYVLIHELVHTKILAHGPRFWAEIAKHVPNLPAVRKEMRAHQPTILGV